MSEVFTLKAGLSIDLSDFEADVKRVEAETAALEARLATLTAAARQAARAVSAAAAPDSSPRSGAITAAVTAALSSVTVELDGQRVGALVAPAVNRELGRLSQEARYLYE